MALWGGRFEKDTDQLMKEFSSSIDIDSRLWEVDIQASTAHVEMLGKQKILSNQDAEAIVQGLKQIHSELTEGRWTFDLKAEDIHGEIERRLFELIGEPAKRMHTARSRNDQVSTDTRLYLKTHVDFLLNDLRAIQTILLDLAEKHVNTILPGMTHLQHAQPVSLAHHLMAYFWMFQRDHQRLSESQKRTLSMPLGSAALAGTGFPLDREYVRQSLGFSEVSANSLDAVSDRDFVLEFLSHASISMMHLSRFCEELILWSTPEFGFIEMGDEVTTGSSIMPQKKNPDAAELIRGRTGRIYGALMGALTMMKALPLSYNRDMQEDKVHLFTGIDTLSASLRLMARALETTKWKTSRMAEALRGDFSNATDLADDLALKGVSFREAHEVVGHIVRKLVEQGKALEDLTLAELKSFHKAFDEDSLKKLPHLAVMTARRSAGGTSPEAVTAQIARARKALD